jgi:hypothetical protein
LEEIITVLRFNIGIMSSRMIYLISRLRSSSMPPDGERKTVTMTSEKCSTSSKSSSKLKEWRQNSLLGTLPETMLIKREKALAGLGERYLLAKDLHKRRVV